MLTIYHFQVLSLPLIPGHFKANQIGPGWGVAFCHLVIDEGQPGRMRMDSLKWMLGSLDGMSYCFLVVDPFGDIFFY